MYCLFFFFGGGGGQHLDINYVQQIRLVLVV